MNALLSLGRWLFPIPFAAFGLMHFMNAEAMSGMVPAYLPAGVFFIYLTGAALLGAAVSMVIRKYDKLATTLLGILVLLTALMIHLPGAMAGGEAAASYIGNFLKDIGLAGAAFLYAKHEAKDASMVG